MHWNTPEVKQLNSEKIRMEIQKNPKCTKAMIAKEVSLSVATCNTIFNELLASREIRVVDQENAIMGRPAIRFEYNEDYYHVMGIIASIGKEEKLEYIIGNALGEIIDSGYVVSDGIDGKQIEELVGKCIAGDKLIKCITVGLPGVNAKGIIERCDISGLVGEPLEKNLKDKFGIDVIVDNDTDIISYGIYHSVFAGKGNLATVLFPAEGDSYVGSGLIINGKILGGASEFAGEIRYIAEAFGITTNEMKVIRKNRTQLLDYAIKMLVILISTIDPRKIVVIGEDFEPDDLEELKAGCERIVSKLHVPEIEIQKNGNADYKHGLMRLAINKISFPLSGLM